MTTLLLKLDASFNFLARICGALAAIATLLLVLNVFYDVVMRYAFNEVSIALQELEWHLFSVAFLLGIPYALLENSHVRVDILYERWSAKTQAWVNLFGTLFFILPFIILVSYYGFNFAMDAFNMGEGSGDPGGLPHRWLIKSMIPVSFVLIGFASLGLITRSLLCLMNIRVEPQHNSSHLV